LLVHADVEEPLVILFQAVPVGGVADREEAAEVLVEVLLVVGEEPLHAAEDQPAAIVLEGWHGAEGPAAAPLVSHVPRVAVVRDDRWAAAEDVGARVLQSPDVEVPEVVRRERGGLASDTAVGIAQVIDQVAAEPSDLAPKGGE